MLGILLAGGNGTRLCPVTSAISKQLLPVYDKPMIHYPLGTLMRAQIREIVVICRPSDRSLFQSALGDGSHLGLRLHYVEQSAPDGIASAILLAAPHLPSSGFCTLILGDNLFHGSDLHEDLAVDSQFSGARIFASRVSQPSHYGVVALDEHGVPVDIEEKPLKPKSNLAVTGLYVYDSQVLDVAGSLVPSARGELEITDVNRKYLQMHQLDVRILPRGTAWLDTGSFEALADATSYVRAVQTREGRMVTCVEEISWENGWIDDSQLIALAEPLLASGYGDYLLGLLR